MPCQPAIVAKRSVISPSRARGRCVLDVHHDPRARRDEGRDHDLRAVVEHRGLVGRGGGLPLHDGVGLDHRADRALRQGHSDHLALDQVHGADHVVGQEVRGLADQVAVDRGLLEALLVHEGVGVAVVEEILHLLLVGAQLLDGLVGAQLDVGLGASARVAHLDLVEGRALPGADHVVLHDAPDLAVVLDDVAGAHGTADDFHGSASSGLGEKARGT